MKNRRGGHLAAQGGRTPAPTRNGSIRLKDYDYATPGAYFVTICTYQREPLLRDNPFHKAVEEAWRWLAIRFPRVQLDEFVVMADHVHFVIGLLDQDARRGGHPAAQGGRTPAPTLPNIVGTFKTVAATTINRARGSVGAAVWQRNYYEHIVRDERELQRIREYIRNNPSAAHTHDADDLAAAWEEEP